MDKLAPSPFQFRPTPADATRVVRPLPVRREPDRPSTDMSGKVGQDDYYLARKRDFEQRHPGLKAPDYYKEYGDKYLRRFKYELRPKLSPEGKKWVDRTLVGLQQKIEKKRAQDPVAFDRLERNPEAFRKFCFDSHPDAYLEGGLNTLSLKEQAMIASTPDAKDLLSLGGIEQAFETGGRLVGDYASHPERFVAPNWREMQKAFEPSRPAPLPGQPLQRPNFQQPLRLPLPGSTSTVKPGAGKFQIPTFVGPNSTFPFNGLGSYDYLNNQKGR